MLQGWEYLQLDIRSASDMMYGSFFNLEKQNVMFTLFFGFMVIWALDLITGFGEQDTLKKIE